MRNYVCVHARALERTRLRLYSALLSRMHFIRMHFIRSPCILAQPSEHTARTPLDSAPLLAQALLAPGPSRLPASATLKPSERPLRAVETAASYV